MKKYRVSDVVKVFTKYDPVQSYLYILLVVINSFAVVFKVYVVAEFIDCLYAYLAKKIDNYSLLMPGILFLITILYEWFSPILTQLLGAKLKAQITRGVREYLTESRAMLQYRHIENAETNDLVNNISDNPENRIYSAIYVVANSLGLVIKICGLLLLISMGMWWGALLILFISIPLLTLGIKSGRKSYQTFSELAKVRRMMNYLKNMLTSRDFLSEKTVFQYGDKINDEWKKQYRYCLGEEMKVKRQWYIRSNTGGMATTVLTLAIICIFLFAVAEGSITIGFFVSTINGCMNLTSNLTWQLPYYLHELVKNYEYARKCLQFQEIEKNRELLCVPSESDFVFQKLEFVDVSFQYPGTEKKILDHVSFKLLPGKHYALVGVNGSGKSTLIKLLSGMYSEYTGQILLNGNDIRLFSYGVIKSLLSIVFQDFARYSISLKDNILLGDINHYEENVDNGKLHEVIQDVGLEELCSFYEQGWDVELGKIRENSVELSGGEWQRIAIARGEVRNAPIIVMDEPTAALDPISESELYQKFSKMNQGKTVVFISHRLGSIKMADEIILLDGGQVQCIGTHDSLMQSNKLYGDLYEEQRRMYK